MKFAHACEIKHIIINNWIPSSKPQMAKIVLCTQEFRKVSEKTLIALIIPLPIILVQEPNAHDKGHRAKGITSTCDNCCTKYIVKDSVIVQ